MQTTAPAITREQLGILLHTRDRASAGAFCGDSPDMQELVRLGLMESAGRVSFVPDEYFRLTPAGRDFLREIPKRA